MGGGGVEGGEKVSGGSAARSDPKTEEAADHRQNNVKAVAGDLRCVAT